MTVPTMATAAMMIKEKPPLRLRHELKYAINAAEDMLVAARLRRLFPHDKNADSHGIYRVSSLYFDDLDDKALRQKIDGTNRREKFRLRYYGDKPDFIRLEKKIKINGLCAKQSARLSAEQVRRLLAGDTAFLLHSGEPLPAELYSKLSGQLLRPRAIVCYDREAFVYAPGNVRVTIDRALRSSLRCTDFLDAARLHMGMSEQRSILEVKYDDFLPELVRMAVQIPNRRAGAYSKYAACRRLE